MDLKNRSCFYCRVPVDLTGAVYFQINENAVPVCLICDEKVFVATEDYEDYE